MDILPFEQHLEACAQRVDDALTHRLSDAPHLDDIAQPIRLLKAMRHALLGGGKRFRAYLVCESAQLFDVPPHYALNVAQSIECLHAYSLIHDDLPAMDDDDMRRGKPTVHKAFDEATAILAGDALQTLAFEILVEPQTHADTGVRCALVHHLARASGLAGMVGGQMLDLAAEGRYGVFAHSQENINLLQMMKTGVLIMYAAQSGALLAQASTENNTALKQYGQALGAIFQITDDILDRESTPAIMGKSTAKDAAKGKATLVDILGLDNARATRDDLIHQAIEALTVFGSKAQRLREAVFFAAHRKM